MDDSIWLQREVRALYAITEAINSSLSLPDLLTIMLERTVVELGYKAATLRLLDQERQTLELKAAYGLSADYLQKGAVEVAKSGIDQTVLRGTPVAIADVGHDPGFQYAAAAAAEGLASVLARAAWRCASACLACCGSTLPSRTNSAPRSGHSSRRWRTSARRRWSARGCIEAFQAIAQQLNSSLELKEVSDDPAARVGE